MPKLVGPLGDVCVETIELDSEASGKKIKKALEDATKNSVVEESLIDGEKHYILGQVTKEIHQCFVLATDKSGTVESTKFHPEKKYKNIYVLNCLWLVFYNEGNYEDASFINASISNADKKPSAQEYLNTIMRFKGNFVV